MRCLLALAIAAASCGPPSQPGEVEAIADALATHGRVEGESIARGGVSFAYAIARRLAVVASREDLAALLRHDSAATRAYAARAILAMHPDALGELRPLLADRASVLLFEGCIIHQLPVATLVIRDVCGAESLEAAEFLAQVAADASLREPLRSFARTCERSDDDGLDEADDDAELELEARSAERMATHPYWRMRFYLASLLDPRELARDTFDGKLPMLRDLARDPDPRVRACAEARERREGGEELGASACAWPPADE